MESLQAHYTSLIITIFCFISVPLLGQKIHEKDKSEILSVMENQRQCWNEGDINCFMKGYWNSDSLRFISKSGITYGWQNTLERYKKNYPSSAAMGFLKFEIHSLEQMDKNNVLMIGKWVLQRENEQLKGYYTLFWKKINGKWVIIIDHTS